jgi:hypothetical protein
MKLALRHSLPADAGRASRAGSAVIGARLVTAFSHAGIVIGSDLYHSNAAKGVHVERGADLSGYLLIDLGDEHDARALELFAAVEGKGYDWVSLAAFIVPGVTDSQRWYCFELAWLLMTSTAPKERITAETLLVEAMSQGGVLMTAPPAVRAVPLGAH